MSFKNIKIVCIGKSFLHKRQGILLEELSKFFKIFCLVPKIKEYPEEEKIVENKNLKKIEMKSLFVNFQQFYIMPNLINYLYKIKPEIIIINSLHSITGLLIIFYKIFNKRSKIIAILALNITIEYNKFIKLFLKFFYKFVDNFIVLTNKVYKKLVNDFNISPNKIFITIETGYKIRKNINKIHKPITILYSGRLEKEKGILEILKAYKILKNKKYNFKIIIHGKKGSLFNYLKEKVKKEKNLEFLGFLSYDSLKETYSRSDIFLYPSYKIRSWEEQLGYSVIEAMSNGLAVIVSNCGALPETVKNAGIIIPQKNYLALANAIEKLLNNEQFLIKMKEKSLKRAKEFSIEKVSDKWKKIILKVLNEKNI